MGYVCILISLNVFTTDWWSWVNKIQLNIHSIYSVQVRMPLMKKIALALNILIVVPLPLPGITFQIMYTRTVTPTVSVLSSMVSSEAAHSSHCNITKANSLFLVEYSFPFWEAKSSNTLFAVPFIGWAVLPLPPFAEVHFLQKHRVLLVNEVYLFCHLGACLQRLKSYLISCTQSSYFSVKSFKLLFWPDACDILDCAGSTRVFTYLSSRLCIWFIIAG